VLQHRECLTGILPLSCSLLLSLSLSLSLIDTGSTSQTGTVALSHLLYLYVTCVRDLSLSPPRSPFLSRTQARARALSHIPSSHQPDGNSRVIVPGVLRCRSTLRSEYALSARLESCHTQVTICKYVCPYKYVCLFICAYVCVYLQTLNLHVYVCVCASEYMNIYYSVCLPRIIQTRVTI